MQPPFAHSYVRRPGRFYARVRPTPVPEPRLVILNAGLAAGLGLDADELGVNAAAMFSGNAPPEDADLIAMAYAGHQFGVFVPSLGDGRAILLGELPGRDGTLYDLQLKGAGRTPFSRGGDGRAALGPMLREYLISEAMHALGIPTTRSLAVVSTGETVFRDAPLPGAILTRVARSHVRVGTFQYFAARGDEEAVRILVEYVIGRHYPELRAAPLPALALLQAVARRQAALVAQWMLVGFIHGVMNTDNMSVAGETIDYGPCAFMDQYDPRTAFSSIDQGGRYAYANQAVIAQWNLARFAETLLPLIDSDTPRAIERATEVLGPFIGEFETCYLEGMRRKLGLSVALEGDAALVKGLLTAMEETRADLTLTFRSLTDELDEAASATPHDSGTGTPLTAWRAEWHARLAKDPLPQAQRAVQMRAANPAYIPRNHRVQAALDAAQHGDHEPFRRLLGILQRPYEAQSEFAAYQAPPRPEEQVLATFCGT
ncbi:MAG: YdiU family protein [Gammaproteobacteria bacterium]|nr:YdiU family protein [Gammaproteobacteria bacterium]